MLGPEPNAYLLVRINRRTSAPGLLSPHDQNSPVGQIALFLTKVPFSQLAGLPEPAPGKTTKFSSCFLTIL